MLRAGVVKLNATAVRAAVQPMSTAMRSLRLRSINATATPPFRIEVILQPNDVHLVLQNAYGSTERYCSRD